MDNITDIQRIRERLGRNTVLNAVIGFPLDHTLSPSLHNALYAAAGLDAHLVPLSKENLNELVELIRFNDIQLTAVTMPFKQSIIPFLDLVDDEAVKLGAVNTVIKKEGGLIGYNTDIVGIRSALEDVAIKNKNVLLLGVGGAALPVAHVIKQAGGRLLVWNRSQDAAQKFAHKFGGIVVNFEQIKANNIDMIINATPVGMYPNVNESPLPLDLLSAHQIVFDLVYRPMQTKLLKDAQSKGIKTIFGMKMFIAQALEQIRLWSGSDLTKFVSESELISLLSGSL